MRDIDVVHVDSTMNNESFLKTFSLLKMLRMQRASEETYQGLFIPCPWIYKVSPTRDIFGQEDGHGFHEI